MCSIYVNTENELKWAQIRTFWCIYLKFLTFETFGWLYSYKEANWVFGGLLWIHTTALSDLICLKKDRHRNSASTWHRSSCAPFLWIINFKHSVMFSASLYRKLLMKTWKATNAPSQNLKSYSCSVFSFRHDTIQPFSSIANPSQIHTSAITTYESTVQLISKLKMTLFLLFQRLTIRPPVY